MNALDIVIMTFEAILVIVAFIMKATQTNILQPSKKSKNSYKNLNIYKGRANQIELHALL